MKKEKWETWEELIINIQTGQSRIRYAIIIGSIVIIIGVLLILQRKKK